MKTFSAQLEAVAARPEQFPPPVLPEVALVGRSNCGKSSLLNKLVGIRRLARVSARPGRTRQLVFFRLEQRLRLVDLPGYGFARAPRQERASWERLVGDYLASRACLVLVLALFDIRRIPDQLDFSLLELLRNRRLAWRAIWTKSDKLPARRLSRRCQELDSQLVTERPGIATSARSGLGRQEVLKLVFTAAERADPRVDR